MSDSPKFIEFLDSHRPPLQAGDYSIKVKQDLSLAPSEALGEGTWTFTVAGPQFSLSPQEIASVFPPAGSLGDHSTCFPHVALHRSTLPWERAGDKSPSEDATNWMEAAMPWLAVLVFDEDDLATNAIRLPTAGSSALTLKELQAPDDVSFPLPDGVSQEIRVASVDVRTDVLNSFVPSAMECRLLCHVRRNILFIIDRNGDQINEQQITDLKSKSSNSGITFKEGSSTTITLLDQTSSCYRLQFIDDKNAQRSFLLWKDETEIKWQVTDEDDAEYAFVIGNRLPKQGKTTTAHLISLEQRFDAKEDHITSDKPYTRFISLHQWRFSCESHEHTFKGLLTKLKQNPSPPRVPNSTHAEGTTNAEDDIETWLAAGFSLLPHQFRNGSQSYSWYRGPLAPGPTKIESLPLPVKSSDALLAYDKRSGLFDANYASAWELGRLLCLANSRISQALYQWKREDRRARRHLTQEMLEKLANLPVDEPPPPKNESNRTLPQVVADWVESMRKLEPVPFQYLIPDERMLPVESIRFFEIDTHWLDCLIDGAFSIGRVLESDHTHDMELLQQLPHEQSAELAPTGESQHRVTGLLLRSAVVSGWPLMTVEAVNQSTEVRAERIRFDRLAPDILLCLFKGSPSRFELHLPQESIHFGADINSKGSFESTRDNELLRKHGIGLLNRRLTLKRSPSLDPAEFALRMIEGVPKVSFERNVTME
ncbi:hypothetical protein KBY93_11115 [Synechococcus sp. J7-Johnson]|uniref:hypothetical protein n=1 Tax=Synechococcus sp. J7-Johnson TaxID=2823737 RepID=UPI0020CCFFA1|nr:hypothetical protein [Synechococcus sp. J7-Johnson]MCP9841177.1 hypothetical protein [Synechococcus sp. J7-Johnson]